MKPVCIAEWGRYKLDSPTLSRGRRCPRKCLPDQRKSLLGIIPNITSSLVLWLICSGCVFPNLRWQRFAVLKLQMMEIPRAILIINGWYSCPGYSAPVACHWNARYFEELVVFGTGSFRIFMINEVLVEIVLIFRWLYFSYTLGVYLYLHCQYIF